LNSSVDNVNKKESDCLEKENSPQNIIQLVNDGNNVNFSTPPICDIETQQQNDEVEFDNGHDVSCEDINFENCDENNVMLLHEYDDVDMNLYEQCAIVLNGK